MIDRRQSPRCFSAREGTVTELPIVVEPTPWLSLIVGLALMVGSFVLARRVVQWYRADEMSRSVVAGAVLAVMALGLGISLAIQNLNWQFRLDEKGITLHAPFDYVRPGGEIAWSDIASLYVSSEGIRGPSFKLRIRGRDGTEIVVANADLLPAQFGPPLQQLVTERAPQAKGGGEIAEELDDVRTHPAAFFASGYSVHNGRGESLR